MVRQRDLEHRVILDDGRIISISPPPAQPFLGQPLPPAPEEDTDFGPTESRPLGDLVFVVNGDKGPSANVGVWARDEKSWPWLRSFLTANRLAELADLPHHVGIERYEQPNLKGLSFVLNDYFLPSSSSNIALDQLGKSLGEFLRARSVEVPVNILD